MQEAEAARSRLAFEELLVLQLRLLLQRTSAQCVQRPCPALPSAWRAASACCAPLACNRLT